MITLFVIIVLIILSLKLQKSFYTWGCASLMFSLIFIFLGSMEEFHSSSMLHGDQHFFMLQAQELCASMDALQEMDIRYAFYPLFIHLSVPCGDYIVQSAVAKINFSILWAIVVGILAYLSKAIDGNISFRYFILLAMVAIGGFFSSQLLRDGFVAIALMLIVLPYLASRKKMVKFFVVMLGILLLAATRPQFLPMLLLAWLCTGVVKVFFNAHHIVRLSIGLFVFGLCILYFTPIPQSVSQFIALMLMPDGTSATSFASMSPGDIYRLLSQGGVEASRYIFTTLITRLPSVFYDANILRTISWTFFDPHYWGSAHELMKYQLFLRALTDAITWIMLGIIFWSIIIRSAKANFRLGKLYSFVLLFVLFASSLYAVKYFGMPRRVFLGPVVMLLTVVLFRPPSVLEVKRYIAPFLLVWLGLNIVYFIVKPYHWIWYYL